MPHYLNGFYAGYLANLELDEAQIRVAIEIMTLYTNQLEKSTTKIDHLYKFEED